MTKQVIVVMMAVVLCAAGAFAEDAYPVAWAVQIGTSGGEKGQAVAVDASGNVYMSGSTSGDLGGVNAGLSDPFLVKFDASGNHLWSSQTGTDNSDTVVSLAVDGLGNAYVNGYTKGGFDGANAGGYDAFVIKFDTSGNELWSRQIGTSVDDVGTGLAADAYGNVYVGGHTYGDVGGVNAGNRDMFVVKYDTAGNEVWSQQFGTARDDYVNSVAVDASGNIYISGGTTYNTGTYLGTIDVVLTKLDPLGNVLWSRQFGSNYTTEIGRSVAIDGFGNPYVGGHTSGDIGGPSAGGTDAFVVKFDDEGNELWSRQIGTSSADYGHTMDVDAAGNAYIAGPTRGSLGGPNEGDYDVFLTKFDPSGNELWSQQIGTPYWDEARSVAVDAFGSAYVSGRTKGGLVGPNAGSYGSDDAFLIKFENPIPEPATLSLLALGGLVALRKTRK